MMMRLIIFLIAYIKQVRDGGITQFKREPRKYQDVGRIFLLQGQGIRWISHHAVILVTQ